MRSILRQPAAHDICPEDPVVIVFHDPSRGVHENGSSILSPECAHPTFPAWQPGSRSPAPWQGRNMKHTMSGTEPRKRVEHLSNSLSASSPTVPAPRNSRVTGGERYNGKGNFGTSKGNRGACNIRENSVGFKSYQPVSSRMNYCSSSSPHSGYPCPQPQSHRTLRNISPTPT